MSDEKTNLPENSTDLPEDSPNLPEDSAHQESDDEQEIESSAVGVGAETDAEGGSQTPEEKLERIAAEHDVPIERDPEDAKAEAEGSSSSDGERDITGGDTKEDEDSASEPPD